MKRIGIITHYFKSTNYGGNLQAYALCKFLNNNGYEAEQICYPVFKPGTKIKVNNLSSIYRIVRSRLTHTLFLAQHIYFKRSQKRTEKAFEVFNSDVIPNSGKIYDDHNFSECLDNYDTFITGSDQVWNFSFFRPEYFLKSVPSDKNKIAYAASISMKSLSDDQMDFLADALSDFKAISVREELAKSLLSSGIPKPIHKVVDPAFLLNSDEWSKIAKDYNVEGDYIFSYFIGNNNGSRNICKAFARKHGIKIVDIPMSNNQYRFTGPQIGDIRATDVSPQEFLGLIRNAKYIFTDSFHASVFSYLFKKQFYVFNRHKNGGMNERIIDIMTQFNLLPYFCNDSSKESIEYISSLPPIDYSSLNTDSINASIERSKCFLKDNVQ